MREADPQRRLAAALGRVPSGLFVLTARHDGMETGMLVSWVQQAGFAPPSLTIAMARERPARRLIDAGGAFAVKFVLSSRRRLRRLRGARTRFAGSFPVFAAASEPIG